MPHGMSTPLVVIHIAKSHPGIELFGQRIAFIHQQPHGRQPHVGSLLHGGFQQLGGYALSSVAAVHGQRVDV